MARTPTTPAWSRVSVSGFDQGIHIMSIVTRHSLMTVVVLVVASLLVIGLFVWSGIYDIGADDTHTRPVHSLLQSLRERSIATRAKELQPPDLADPVRIKQGAGN